MPKWLGMLIHYLTFKKVRTSKEGWTFAWERQGEWELFSFFPMKFTQYRIEIDGRQTPNGFYTPERWGGRLWLKD